MRVKQIGLPWFREINANYNQRIGAALDLLLQAQNEGPVGYIRSRTFTSFGGSWRARTNGTRIVSSAYRIPTGSVERFDVTGFGPYEHLVLSCLTWGPYSTYVLAGDVGSGKTAVTKKILQVLKTPRSLCEACQRCEPIVVHVNFNSGFAGKDADALVIKFRRLVYKKLRKEARRVFKAGSLTDAFLQSVIEDKEGILDEFDELVQDREDHPEEWRNYSEQDKSSRLLSFVDQESDKGEKGLETIMILVRFIRDRLRPDPACLVLVFDNLDSVSADAQMDILSEILAYQDIAKSKALVVLRWTTFERISSQAAYTFGVIQHSGPGPREVITRRLKHFLDDWPAFELAANLSPEDSAALRRRASYLLTNTGPHGPLARCLAFSGSSVRHALRVMRRAFVNEAIRFDRDPQYKADMVRAVIVADGAKRNLQPTDKCIANIFLNRKTGYGDLLNLRILQLIADLEGAPEARSLSNLYLILRAMGGWPGTEILYAINYLLRAERPLIWVDAITKYESVENLTRGEDVPYLTEAGKKQLDDVMGDLVYVQEALLSVNWRNSNLPRTVDRESLTNRFRILRGQLKLLMEEDWRETEALVRWTARRDTRMAFRVSPSLLTNRILASVGEATLNVLMATPSRQAVEIKQELQSWFSCMIDGLNKEDYLFKQLNKELDKVSRRIEKYLRTHAD